MIDSEDQLSGCTPIRVSFLDHTAQLGGGEVALLRLVNNLDQTRYFPIVLLFSDGPLVRQLRDSGIETHVLHLDGAIVHARKDALGWRTLLRFRDGLRLIRFAARVAGFVREKRIDILHANSLKADIIAALAGWMARVPVIWHVRDRIAPDYLPSGVAKLFRLLCRVMPDYVIANSRSTLETIGPGALRTAIPSGIEFGRRRQVVHDGLAHESADASARGVEQPQSDVRIGLVGRISRWKGQHVFLRAAARVLRSFPRARFIIVGAAMFGEVEYEKRLNQLVRELDIAGRVEFMGFREDIDAVVEQLDVVVHASTLPEPFGQIVIEAMASAKPVVATRGGGVMEIVDDKVNGLLVPMGDHDAMADAIGWILTNPTAARDMGHRARMKVLRQFRIEKTVMQVQEVYDFLLDTRLGLMRPVRSDSRKVVGRFSPSIDRAMGRAVPFEQR